MSNEVKKEKESFASYNVIRNRLLDYSKDLKDKLDKINSERILIFGESIAKILKNESVLTENNCIPRDIFSIGNKIILGYNVFIGLKSTVNLRDVFATYEYNDGTFTKIENTILQDEKFLSEFNDLYKYYKESFFAKFFQKNGYLYMVFQNGNDINNIKTFKWLINEHKLEYQGNRSTQDVDYGNQQELLWKRTVRENQIYGDFSHISIEDKIFVETIGGDLTLKIENNTQSGEGIYSEPVENKDQKLDDSEIYYAVIGNLILLKIKPYQENLFRYLVFNEKTREVFRVDSIEKSVVLLPENQGLIVPNGIIGQSGGFTPFNLNFTNCVFQEKRASINGEDFEYIYYSFEKGEYYIYSYNIINGKINPPLVVNGFTHFPNGHLVVFKADEDPKKNHTLQIWETSFSSELKTVDNNKNDSLLVKIGNKTIVSAISDMILLYRLARKEDNYYGLYIDIAKDADSIINKYFWLDNNDVFNIKASLMNIKEAATLAIKEFEKVSKIKENSLLAISTLEKKLSSTLKNIEYTTFEKVNDYVLALTELRKLRGEVASLKDLEFIDLKKVDVMTDRIKKINDKLSEECVNFLLKKESLNPYIEQVEICKNGLDKINKVIEAKELEKNTVNISEDLELLINIVNNLKIEDTTKTAEIIDKISELFSHLNQIKSKLTNIITNMDSKERKSEFYSKLNLITQSVSNYLGLCDTVEKSNSYLTKLVVQLDELESKFSDFDEFIPQLTEKREEIVSAFTTKKQNLSEIKNKKINSLFQGADRVFKGLENRLKTIDDYALINEIFSGDLMIEKIRDIVDKLISLGDSTKASEIESRLKSLKENSVRQLKDKKELFVDGNTIKFGKNSFLVTEEEAELTMLRKDNKFYFHISGTDFWEEIPENLLEKYSKVWNQEIVSENENVYRSEFLAYKIFQSFQVDNRLNELYLKSDEGVKELIKSYIENHYNEYYIKGVHDSDAFIILKSIISLNNEIELAIYKPIIRVTGQLFFNYGLEPQEKELLLNRLKNLNLISKYSKRNIISDFIPSLEEKINNFYEAYTWFPKEDVVKIGNYIAMEISKNDNFVLSLEASELLKEFYSFLNGKNAKSDFTLGLSRLKNDFHGSYIFIKEWLNSFAHDKKIENSNYLIELIPVILLEDIENRRVVKVKQNFKVSGVLGMHQTIQNGEYTLNLLDFFDKLDDFCKFNVSDFYSFQEAKIKLITHMKRNMKFEEFKSTVLTSFVRNKLINDVYLPLIGDNFAKQIGVAGENKRTDNMGMLLLISPPGYGKTTLMEYIASRLNMLMVKINCPTLGHKVTSLDPNEAPNVTAKEELEKLNLAFEIGNNVIIYLDDIQHSNPEFLQKFISLCDGQRKIEGIYKGNSKSYSFRGKKLAVVMAGNPYTESGDKFQIPDMLSNRADVYNLGDMLRENEDAFKLSYLENAMTSNPTLNKLYLKSQEDTYRIINAINENNRENMELLETYTENDIEEYWVILKNMLKIRDEILRVNMEYISSAAQNEKYRIEPPFKLQGSYRNMNKIAEKIVSAMNEKEIKNLISKAYENDAQTLASDAEASLLKFKEITNRLDDITLARWEQIKSIYLENKRSQSGDRVVQVVEELSKIGVNLKLLGELLKLTNT